MFFFGMASALYLGLKKLWFVYRDIPATLVTNSPYFYIALTCMILGTQLFLAGFLAELVCRNSPTRNNYLIAKRINIDDGR